jgi:site-specific DNA recombinase
MKLVASRGWELAGEYSDLGITGTRGGERRPGFKRLVDDAVAGMFAAIVVYDRSRLSRQDAYEYAAAVMPLRNAGIHLESVMDGVERWDSMGGRVLGMVNQEAKHEFAINVARDSTRTIINKAVELRGIPGFARPYGYRRVTTVDGRYRISTLEIVPDEADVVRRIFNAYAKPAGSITSVVMMLNADGIPTTRNGRWCHSTVFKLLRNPVVVGDIVWGRQSRGQHFTRGVDGPVPRATARRDDRGRTMAATNAVPPIVHRDVVPAIIPREQFDAVQRILSERGSRKTSPPKIRPLSGLVRCGSCGGNMRFDGNYVRCNHDRAGHYERCSWRSFKAGPLTDTVFGWLHDAIDNPRHKKLLRDEVRRQAAAMVAASGDKVGRGREIDRRLRDIAGEVDRGVRRLTLLGDDAAAAMADHLNTLARDRAALERERDSLVVATGASDVAGMVDAAMAAADDLRATLQGGEPVAVNAVLRRLGVTLTIRATKGQRGATVVEASAPAGTAAIISPTTPVSTTHWCRGDQARSAAAAGVSSGRRSAKNADTPDSRSHGCRGDQAGLIVLATWKVSM